MRPLRCRAVRHRSGPQAGPSALQLQLQLQRQQLRAVPRLLRAALDCLQGRPHFQLSFFSPEGPAFSYITSCLQLPTASKLFSDNSSLSSHRPTPPSSPTHGNRRMTSAQPLVPPRLITLFVSTANPLPSTPLRKTRSRQRASVSNESAMDPTSTWCHTQTAPTASFSPASPVRSG